MFFCDYSFILISSYVFVVRHKGVQVSPAQQTEVTQFGGSDTEILTDHPVDTFTGSVLEGRQGSPAGKLPPILNVVGRKLFYF